MPAVLGLRQERLGSAARWLLGRKAESSGPGKGQRQGGQARAGPGQHVPTEVGLRLCLAKTSLPPCTADMDTAVRVRPPGGKEVGNAEGSVPDPPGCRGGEEVPSGR